MRRDKQVRPLYFELQHAIMDYIREKNLEPGDRIPSERELCELYRASRSSIRKAIRNLTYEGSLSSLPGKGTFIAGKLDTVPVVSAKTGIIGFAVLFSDLDRRRSDLDRDVPENGNTSPDIPFYSDVFEGANRELGKYGMHLLFFKGYQDSPAEVSRFKEFLKKTDGVIICELSTPKLVKLIDTFSLPTLLINPSVDSHPTKQDLLLVENRDGASEAVNHLIGLGHREIGLINHPTHHNDPARERLRGYKIALQKAGIHFDQENVEEGDWSMQSGITAMKRLLKRKPDMTAVFVANDEMAVGAMKAIKEVGLNIPQDISVVGFDDTQVSSNAFIALTTVRVPRREMGRYATQRIIERSREPDLIPVKVVFPAHLVVRGTTGKFNLPGVGNATDRQ